MQISVVFMHALLSVNVLLCVPQRESHFATDQVVVCIAVHTVVTVCGDYFSEL